MKFNDDEKFLFQEKTGSALVFIYQKEVTYISEVAANIDSTFSHTNKIIKRLQEIGLLTSVFEGRSRFLQLTPRGYYFAQHFSEALDIFRSPDEVEFPDGYVPTRREEELPPVPAEISDISLPVSESAAPVSASAADSPVTLAGRIQLFSIRIKEIYEAQTALGADAETLLRNLGPYDRELKMLSREISKLDPDDEMTPDVLSAYRAAEMQYSFYLGKE